MNKRKYFTIIGVSVFLVLSLLVSCDEPKVNAKGSGSLSGRAIFNNGIDNHAGIMISIEKGDFSRDVDDDSRSILASTITGSDGTYEFSALESGFYTIYASDPNSVEKVVTTGAYVDEGRSTRANDIMLTPTGVIEGYIIAMSGESSEDFSRPRWIVFANGTSYMAVADADGHFRLTGIPAVRYSSWTLSAMYGNKTYSSILFTDFTDSTYIDAGYIYLVVDEEEKEKPSDSFTWLGYLEEFPDSPAINTAFYYMPEGSSYIYNGHAWNIFAYNGNIQNPFSWLGSFSSAPFNPRTNQAYYNTQDGCSYIYNGYSWNLLASKGGKGDTGAAGSSITWLGSFATAPSEASVNNAYFNTEDGCSYIYDGTKWTLLAARGEDGDNGDAGISLVWLGSFAEAPANPAVNNAYFNTKDGCSYIYNGTQWNLLAARGEDGDDGDAGISLVWLGSFAEAPANPAVNNAYFNTEDGCSYIYNGSSWAILASKGDKGDTGSAGISLVWLGSFAEAPAEPSVNNAYFNTEDGCSYIYDGSSWTLLASKGDKGDKGDSFTWKGSLSAAPINPSVNWAYRNTEDGCTYIFDGEDWSILASSSESGSGTELHIPSTLKTVSSLFGYITDIETVIVEDGVTAIAPHAFKDCISIKTIVIPNSVTSIGLGAFEGCINLESMTLPLNSGMTLSHIFGNSSIPVKEITCTYADASSILDSAFRYSYNLESITFACSVRSIGEYAFSNCKRLTSINIPSGVTSIGRYAFSGCEGLTEISLPSGLKSIPDYMFDSCFNLLAVDIPDGVNTIGERAFSRCWSLESLTIPATVTSIKDGAFEGCGSLESLVIPNSISSIGSSVFAACSELSISCDVNLLSLNRDVYRNYDGLITAVIPDNITDLEYVFFGCSELTSIVIPENITSIGTHAFDGCYKLTSIVIPESVTSIGQYAFADTGLSSIIIPSSVKTVGSYAFYHCDGLNVSITGELTKFSKYTFSECTNLSVTLPDNLTAIDNSAFEGCIGLTSIKIPTSVTSIGNSAFSGCSGLTSIEIPTSVTSIGWSAFRDCSGIIESIVFENVLLRGAVQDGVGIIPEGVSSIGEYAFSSCSDLTSIVIPTSVTNIGSSAFYRCDSLEEISIPFVGGSETSNTYLGYFFGAFGYYNNSSYVPSSLKKVVIEEGARSIEDYAFYGCRGLASIEIPASVTSIGNSSFYGCSGLTSIEIPASVTSIGDSAFYGCSGLTSIEIPTSVTSIGRSAFRDCSGIIESIVFENVLLRGAVQDGVGIIPEGVSSIGEYAFSSCSDLTGIVIPTSVTSIGDAAFSGCSGLTSIEIPTSVTSIGWSAFYGCSGLTSIEIPASVTNIGSSAFYRCDSLEEISIPFVGGSETSNTYLGYIFGASAYNNNSSYVPSSLKKVVIEEGARSIEDYAFYGCRGLASIEIPASVTSISWYAFSGTVSSLLINIGKPQDSLYGAPWGANNAVITWAE